MTKVQVQMEISPWDKALLLLRAAVHAGPKPSDWRQSEWAVTKGNAKRLVDSIEQQLVESDIGVCVSLDVFDWTLLESELARFARNAKRPDAVELALLIRRRLLLDPKAGPIVETAEQIEKTQKALEKSERARERLKKKLDRLTLRARS